MPTSFAKPWWVLWVWLCLGFGGVAWGQQISPAAQTTQKAAIIRQTKKVPVRQVPAIRNAPTRPKKRAIPTPDSPILEDTTSRRLNVVGDSLLAARHDTGSSDTVRVSNDLATTVTYTADDSIVFSAKSKVARLYKNADITYGDINLKADEVQVDYQTNIVNARGTRDSTGRKVGVPIFTQGSDKYQADSMRYNFKTRKGLIRQVITQQGDGYLHGEAVKRESETSLYVRNAEYTTCNLEHPHFYIKSYKMKMIPGQKLVSGPFLLHIADVPTPLGFIFGFFPIPKYKSSGILIPTYGESTDLGFFLRNGGFYFALSDYFDIKMLGEIYSLGGWGLTPQSTYRKRYRYDGNINLRYNNRSVALPDGRRLNGATQEFWVNWTHTPSPRGSSRFSASVSAGSNFSQQQYNFSQNALFTTSYTSNVSYSKTFEGTPFNLNVSGRINQNVQSKEVTVDLPTVAFTMNRIYPFKPKGSSKSNFITNLNVAYNLTGQNTISNIRPSQTRSLPLGLANLSDAPPVEGVIQNATGSNIIPVSGKSIPTLLRQAQLGVRHTIPITTTVRVLRYFNVSPSFTYNETWYPSKLKYTYGQDSTGQVGVHIDTSRGFNRFYTFNTGASVSTQIYGTFFIRRGRLEAIRHRITPTVGFSYAPDFGTQTFGFNQQITGAAGQVYNLDPYQGFVLGGAPQGGKVGAINFSVTNVIEAKLRKVSDSGKTTYTKKNLIENLSFNGSYNAIADSFRLSPISISLNTRLLDKIQLATSATFNPYQRQLISGTTAYRDRPTYALKAGQGLGRISNANFSVGYSYQPGGAGKGKKETPRRQLSEAEERDLSFVYANPNLFVDFTVPFTLSLQYVAAYFYQDPGATGKAFTHNVRTNGDISLSPKWKVGFDAPFDFQTKKFASTNLNIYRDLHCWEMRMSVALSGTRPYYNFDINVKASILQDLKLSKRNSFYDR